MKIKDAFFGYLSFGEEPKVKEDENAIFATASKLTFGASAIKSSLIKDDYKYIFKQVALKTLPFAFLTVLIYGLLVGLGGNVFEMAKHFGAGMVCYFAFILIEAFKSNINHAKTHKILKPSLIIAAITFILTSGVAITGLYNCVFKEYNLRFDYLQVSLLPIIFALINFAVLTDGKPQFNKQAIISGLLSALFLITNLQFLSTVSWVFYIRILLFIAMVVLMVLHIVKQNKDLKINYKKPAIILGVTAGIVLVIALILSFVFGENKTVIFSLSTAFASIFSGDVSSLAAFEGTIGNGAVTNDIALYGLISPISYIMPGSFLINAIAAASFDAGFKGNYALICGTLYSVMGIVIALGLTISVVSYYKEFVKAGGNIKTMVAVKRYVNAVILGVIPVTVLSLILSFSELVRASYDGVFVILFAVGLISVIYAICNNYKVNRNIVAICAGIFTLFVMIFSNGILVY